MAKVVKKLDKMGIVKEGKTIEKQDVSAIINKKTFDELHRIIRGGYKQRVKRSTISYK